VLPATPYRGIRPFRYVDHAIFFAREQETERLTSLVAVYRGTMLYGMTGAGKSSLINAGLLPRAVELGFQPERVRVQPRDGEALVVERIATADDGSRALPSLLAGPDDGSGRIVLSIEDFERRVQTACNEQRPLLVFDQFEELCTLFDTDTAGELRQRIVEMLVRLLRAPLPVKLLFVFREDYLGKIKQLLAACPELVDQALPLSPLAARTLPTIIRGPFERYPGHFARELGPALAERLRVALAERFGAGELSLSEVQTVCLRLWQAADPESLLAEKGVQGLLEDYLGEALDAFPLQTRFAAVALLSQMVTPAGTRNVISAEDLIHRVREQDAALSPSLLKDALHRLDRESRLVRRERRRDLDLYEITSEFLVPWISAQRAQARRLRERRRDRRRLLVLGSIAAVLLVVVAGFLVLMLEARRERASARRERSSVTALALSSASVAQSDKRIDVPLLLALGAYGVERNIQSQDALMKALVNLRKSEASGVMHGHSGPVQAVAVSPDSQSIASASTDGTVRLWNARSHRQIGKPLEMDTARVATDVAFTPDGKRLASGSDDGSVFIWDLASHSLIAQLSGHTEGVTAIAISPDGGRLASASYDESVRIWDLATHKEIALLAHVQKETRHVAFNLDGSQLVTGTEKGDVQLWSTATYHRLGRTLSYDGERSAINAVAFSRGGLVAAGSDKGEVHFWNAATRAPAGGLHDPPEGLSSFAFSRDGKTLVSTTWNEEIWQWKVATGTPMGKPFHSTNTEIEDVALMPDGTALVTADWDGSVRLWSTHPQGGFEPPLSGHKGSVNDVAFDPDGKTLASAGTDGTVRLWSVKDRKQLALLPGLTGEPKSIAFNKDGTLLAAGSSDGGVRVWNVATRESVRVLSDDGQEVSAVAFSLDGKKLASATGSGMVRLWDVSSWRSRTWSAKSGDSLVSLAFSRDRKLIATGDNSGTIVLWNAVTGKQVGGRPLSGHTSEVRALAFSPVETELLASASEDETVRLWNVETHTQIGEALRDHKKAVDDVTFSPDGRLLASAGADNAVRLWDAKSGAPLGTPLTPDTEATVKAVAFDHDGTTLVSANEDGTIHLWPGVLWRSDEVPLAQICKTVGGGLSPEEWKHYVLSVPYRRICRE
jgi:WD40 repeat protein